MPITNFLGFSTTAASNTDVNGIGIQGTNAVNNFDNAFREFLAIFRRDLDGRMVITSKSAGYTAVANDNNAVIRFSAAATLSLTAAATLGSGWHVQVVANGGDVVIDPNGSETIDGRTTLTVRDGSTALVICDGTNFRTNLQADQRVARGLINGLTLSNNASDATNDIDIATGEAASDGTIPYLMVLGSALTKRLDAAWAVGTGNGGLDTGAIADTTYHVWLIQRSDTGVVDALFSTSATSPTMPTNYDRKRRIGSILRASSTIRPFSQIGDDFYLATSVSNYNSTSALAATLTAVTVPAGINVTPFLSFRQSQSTVGDIRTSVGSPQNGISADLPEVIATRAAGEYSVAYVSSGVVTNVNQQVILRVVINSGTLATNVVQTYGWSDPRGR